MSRIPRTNAGLKKIDLEDITIKKNSRKKFTNIEELADSISYTKQLIEPIVVEPNPDGGYFLTAGERRYKAHQLLVKRGEPFNQISAVVMTGNRSIIQLVENVNRENLTAEETENALQELIDSGMTQTEISQRTGKRLSWVSDILAAGKARDKAESAGVSTEGMSSSAMSTLRGEPPEVIQEVQEAGGSVKEAVRVKKYRKLKTTPPGPPKDQKHQAFYEGQIMYDDQGRKIAVVLSADGETGTVKEIKG